MKAKNQPKILLNLSLHKKNKNYHQERVEGRAENRPALEGLKVPSRILAKLQSIQLSRSIIKLLLKKL